MQLDRWNRIALFEDALRNLVVLDVVRVFQRFEPWIQLLGAPNQVWCLFPKAVGGAGSTLDHFNELRIVSVHGTVPERC